jgi:hypothetical protein
VAAQVVLIVLALTVVLAAAVVGTALVRVVLLHQGRVIMAATVAMPMAPLAAAERVPLEIMAQHTLPLAEGTVLLHPSQAHL